MPVFHSIGHTISQEAMMRETMKAVGITGTLVLTILLGFLTKKYAPQSVQDVAALPLLAVILTFAFLVARKRAKGNPTTFSAGFWDIAACFCWLSFLSFAAAFHTVLSSLNSTSAMFTIMFPVTMPPALRTIFASSRGADKERTAQNNLAGYPRSREMAGISFFIAVGHLLAFWPQTSPATKLFLLVYAAVSLMAFRTMRREDFPEATKN